LIPTDEPGTILVDFDGTVTQVDVGNRVFHTLTKGGAKAVVDLWKTGTIGSRECMIRECALARGTEGSILDLVREIPLDPGFLSFVSEVDRRGWRVRVVSDGLDLYIRSILEREGLGHLPVEANGIRFVQDRLLPTFPFTGRGCGRCGNCKGGAVQEAAREGNVIFVGNGLSDRCGARRAPRVFAKDDLARFCREEGITFESFETFEDVRRAVVDGVPEVM